MFRAITLNLNYLETRHGAWPERRKLVTEVIERWRPHIVALQAVSTVPEGLSQAHELSKALPDYDHVWFEPAMERIDHAKGSAFLARIPLPRRHTRALSLRAGTDDTNRRTILRVQCDMANGIDVFNAHFSWVTDQATDNLQEALPFLAEVRGPALLMGDFNFKPDSPLHEQLRNGGWLDVWAAMRPADPGYTFEADSPSQRIDYVYANPLLAARVKSIDCVGKQGGTPPRLSDHLGLMVTID